jgi:uncharacterized protein GlcG (DUF336 family)|nr:heme-binding protein [Limosilactobacillus avium]
MDEDQLKKVIRNIMSETQSKSSSSTNVSGTIKESSLDEMFDRHKMERVIDAAVDKANEIGVGVTIAIMKNNQVLQMSYHMPNANLVSCTLAPKKAWSALAMKEPTKDISPDIQPGAGLYQMETMLDGRLASFAGGIPLVIDGKMIGSIGVSGGLVEEDEAICEAAVAAFLKETK